MAAKKSNGGGTKGKAAVSAGGTAPAPMKPLGKGRGPALKGGGKKSGGKAC